MSHIDNPLGKMHQRLETADALGGPEGGPTRGVVVQQPPSPVGGIPVAFARWAARSPFL